jgi:excisionase family DNA binding protein
MLRSDECSCPRTFPTAVPARSAVPESPDVQSQQPNRELATFRKGRDSQQIDPVPGALLTADQVARLLGVPRAWVYEQSRCGRIPTVTLGRYRRYRREAIEAWIRDLEAAGAGVGGLGPRGR